MSRTSQQHDGTETDRALSRLVGLVVVIALIAVVLAGVKALSHPMDSGRALSMAALGLLFVVASMTQVRVRVRSTIVGFSWNDVATMTAVFILPGPIAVLVIFFAALIPKLIQRSGVMKVAFAAAKAALNTGSAALVLAAFHVDAIKQPVDLLPYSLAFLALIVCDEIISTPVLALATRTSAREIFFSNLDIRWGFNAIRLGVAALAIYLMQEVPELLIAVPPVVLSLHLMHQGRLRARAERQAWQRLAESTDSFNAIQMDQVLKTAVHNGAQLFSVDQVEVETWLEEPHQLIRGNTAGVVHFGPPDRKG